jgi:hypothetical protein
MVVALLAANCSHAGPWNITELFSNADGSVQFIELTCVSDGQQDLDGGTITSFVTGKVYTIPTDAPSSVTANQSLLITTDNFELLPGAILPDYPTFPGLPANFFDPFGPVGDAIEVKHTTHGIMDTRAFFAGAVPTDGVHSLDLKLNAVTVNTPTNFAGQTGSVNAVARTGDYNNNGVVDAADFVVWRQNLNTTNTIPNDSTPESISSVDYDIWRAAFGNGASGGGAGAGSAVPEPGTLFGALTVAMIAGSCRRR